MCGGIILMIFFLLLPLYSNCSERYGVIEEKGDMFYDAAL